jgi:2-polyprenyl-6-methoxyphenol hydroxylase-like FAD-dependent oxidoreductase
LKSERRNWARRFGAGTSGWGCTRMSQGVRVEVQTRSRTYELAGQYLIACDGAHSVVRKQLGVAFPGLDPTIIGRMGDVKLTADALELLKQNVPELRGREFGLGHCSPGI